MAGKNQASPAVKAPAQEGTVARHGVFVALLHRMAYLASEENESFAMGDSVTAILNADTEEEMWAADDKGPLGGRDLADVEQEVRELDVKFSRNQDMKTPFIDPDTGKHMYYWVRSARLSDGEEFQWNTSAPLIVAKLDWLERHGKLPYRCVIRETDLGGGQAVLKLKPLTERAL